MRIAIWRTEHEIAATVAKACHEGFGGDSQLAMYWNESLITSYDVHIGYGILRKMGDVMKACEQLNKPFFHLDKGYWNPNHYLGNYRISYKGTQARWHDGIPKGKWNGELEQIKKDGEYTLVCPPTDEVCKFFGIKIYNDRLVKTDWEYAACQQAFRFSKKTIVRHKSSSNPIDWGNIRAVITFNSSVGWEAVRRGIPCLSDINHSLVGSLYGETDLQKLLQKFHEGPDRRQELFDTMTGHQFTLAEIKQGKAWNLINYYIKSSSDSIAEKLLPPMCAPTPSKNAPLPNFQLNT